MTVSLFLHLQLADVFAKYAIFSDPEEFWKTVPHRLHSAGYEFLQCQSCRTNLHVDPAIIFIDASIIVSIEIS